METLVVLSLLGIALLGTFILLWLLGVVRYIPNHRVGVVEKLFSFRHGSVESGFIALKHEAGFQPEVLRGGWHLFPPLQYRVHQVPLVTIPQGRIGYVYARDGELLATTQALASNGTIHDFEDTRAFLAGGGQRGPQRRILREGTYAINLVQFVVFVDETTYMLPLDRTEIATFRQMSELIGARGGFAPVVIRGADDNVGIVTVHDGPSLPDTEIIAPTVGADPADTHTWHNNFQDADHFLQAGGYRGRQLQVLTEGTWYINRLFATVEMIPKTVIEVGTVGVVVSYTGSRGADLSGEDYKHGELVEVGQRGVWKEPLLPGKYAYNTFAGRVVAVPTTNFILKWVRTEVGQHRYDENLAEVNLITKDAFEPTLPLSVVVHIDYRKAPLVVQRFGDIKRLVEQTLDPMVAAYFKNVGQTRTLIQLIHERSEIQRTASLEMQEKFDHYNLQLEEVLIGTPGSGASDGAIERMLGQIRARQIAEEQVETYARQERAAGKERELREAEARAAQQAALTQSELSITIQSNQGKAEYERALQKANQVRAMAEAEAAQNRTLAEAEAAKIRMTGEAEADRVARVGMAQAIAAEEQVRAYGGPRLQITQAVLTRFAEAVEKGHVEVVPRVVMGGDGAHSAFDTLMSMLLANADVDAGPSDVVRSPEVEALRASMKDTLSRPAPRA